MKSAKAIVIIAWMFIHSCYLFSQNLIPNYSFEDTIMCPNGTITMDDIEYWFQPTTGTSDAFHECASPGTRGVPSNFIGFQYAFTGVGYAGIISYAPAPNNNYREYIEVKLNSTLSFNDVYCVEFYANLANGSEYAIDRIGAVFSTDSLKSSDWFVLPYKPAIENPKGNIISDTALWTLVSGIYVAGGGENSLRLVIFMKATVQQQ